MKYVQSSSIGGGQQLFASSDYENSFRQIPNIGLMGGDSGLDGRGHLVGSEMRPGREAHGV
jgi:hypothetical protein